MRERIIKSPIDFPVRIRHFYAFQLSVKLQEMPCLHIELGSLGRATGIAGLIPSVSRACCFLGSLERSVPPGRCPACMSLCGTAQACLLPSLGVHYWNFFSWTFVTLLCFRGFTLCCVILKVWWVTKRLWGTEVFIRKQV